MTKQYTPTTEQVRDDYQRCGCDRCSLTDDSDLADEHAEFDLWLAEHDRELQAEAWDDGQRDQLEAQEITLPRGVTIPLAPNPHRKETE